MKDIRENIWHSMKEEYKSLYNNSMNSIKLSIYYNSCKKVDELAMPSLPTRDVIKTLLFLL